MHVNSLLAYYGNRKTFDQREMMILGWLLINPGEWTARQIKTGLGFEDMNAVAPRICRLLKPEIEALVEAGSVPCPVTGVAVRTVRLSEKFLSGAVVRPEKQKVNVGCEVKNHWKRPEKVGQQGALFRM